jgi:hypothetical protein
MIDSREKQFAGIVGGDKLSSISAGYRIIIGPQGDFHSRG